MNTKWLYKILFLFMLIINSSVYADYYLKATDYNTAEFTKSDIGAWYKHNNPKYNDDYLSTFSWDYASQNATWQKNISSGEYKVYAFIPDLSSSYIVGDGQTYKATKNAHYSIYSNGSNISNKTISQSGDGWKYIGKYNIGSSFKIKLTDKATSYEKDNKYSILFSTIKLVPTAISNGNLPVAKRDDPTGQNVTLAINESQLFQFEATDVDNDIDYVQISSSGKTTDKDTCYTFCSSKSVQERYSWSSAGNYTVHGYVQDERGNSNSVIWNVTVLPNTTHLLVATRENPSDQNITLEVGESKNFKVKGTDSYGDIDYARIYSSNKNTETDTCQSSCEYQYADKTYSWSSAGNYTVTGEVRDDTGKTSYVTWNVTVTGSTPQIAKLQAYSITPSSGNIQTNQNVNFKALIKNRGNTTSGNIKIKWYKDNSWFSTDWIGASQYFSKIDAGSSDDDWSSNTSFSTGGNKKIKFCISQKGSNDQYYNSQSCKEITINVATPTTPNNPPTIPSAIYKSSSTENSISIRWNASSDSDGSISKYYVEYYTNRLGNFKSCGSTSNINITCSSLSKNTNYKFRVRAKDNNGSYSSWKESSYFSTDSETQYAPVLNNTQNLPTCSTGSKKCIFLTDQAILKFNITDQNSNLSRIEINWDGVGSPEDTQSISGSSSNITTSHTFNSSDIANCPNNDIFKADGVCYRKDITVTVTAYDTTGKTSSSFFQEFVLYDWAGWNDAKEREEQKLTNKESEESNYDLEIPILENTCKQDRYPLLTTDIELRKKDPAIKVSNLSVACGLGSNKKYKKICSESIAGINSGCKEGLLDYEIYIQHDAYSESDGTVQGCINYPASILSFYTVNGNRKLYNQGFVNNYKHKESYLIEELNELKNKLKLSSNGIYQPACYVDDFDYKNWDANQWKLKIANLPELENLVQKYQAKFPNANALEVAKGVKDGTAEALEYIAGEYKDLPSDAIDLAKGVISLIGNFITDPVATAQSTIDTAGKIKDFVVELVDDSSEIIDKLTDTISHWSSYEKSKYYTQFTVLAAHEIVSPAQKLKLIKKISKSGKLRPPSFLIDAYLLVKFKSLGFSMSKNNLDNFVKHQDRKNYVYDELKISKGELAEKDIILVKASSGNDKKNGQWWQNILRGNEFNKEQWNPNIRNELILCKSPNGCNLNPPKYVRLDAYNDKVNPPQIISRKHTQFSKIKTSTAKSYIDELARKYKSGMTVPYVDSTIKGTKKNKTNIGMAGEQIKGNQILQIPKQDKAISQELLDYANSKDIEIIEVMTNIK